MSKEKNKLIPELRFPEFVEEGEWVRRSLGDITYVVSKRNKNNKKFPVYSINNKNGFLPQAQQFEGVNSNSRGYDISLYKIVEKNTFAYNPARIDVGSIGYSGKLHNIIISSLYVCFKATDDIEDNFLLYFFETDQFSRAVKNNVEGGIRNYLFYGNFSNIDTFVPSFQEQHKIASSLSSLDQLITAHNQKLELLRDHKKGLMQNLFPQNDEKVPKYRFAEFENDGDWDQTTIGAIAKVSAGGTPKSTKPDYWNGDIPWMNSGELNNKRIYSVSNSITSKGLEESSTKLIPPGCILVGLAGQGKTRGTAAINYIELCTNQSIGSIHPNEEVFDSEFLYQKIDSLYERLRYLSTGDGGRGGLNLKIIKSIQLSLPKMKEQQKIASSLSSLDVLITAESERIEQLELHKKGLMQGLFPRS